MPFGGKREREREKEREREYLTIIINKTPSPNTPNWYFSPAASPPSSSSSLASAMAIVAETQFHVLAVDDSLLDRKLIERLLKSSCYQVTTVDSVSKALEFLGLLDGQQKAAEPLPVNARRHEIEVNLIITDYCMPGMTGYDLLKKIKESSSLKDIPVVIMSSENVPSRINRCLEGGAEEFFLKPVQLSDMKKLRPHILKCKSKMQQQPLQNSSTNICINGNKRKATDERISIERTRLRYSTTSLTLL